MKDFSVEVVNELDQIQSTQEFCKNWTAKWRGMAVAAQSVLNIFFPAGAKILGYLITIADTYCATP